MSFHVISYVADGETGTGLTEEQRTQGNALCPVAMEKITAIIANLTKIHETCCMFHW